MGAFAAGLGKKLAKSMGKRLENRAKNPGSRGSGGSGPSTDQALDTLSKIQTPKRGSKNNGSKY